MILGLLTGGILTGQSLIKASELRSVTTEFQEYQTAVNSFKHKYFALPGDMTNATQFWGSASGATCTHGTTGTGSDIETCNGNGDGVIMGAGDANRYVEMFMFWQHLANAGVINGVFTGKSGSNDYDHAVINENIPAAKFAGAGWSILEDILPDAPSGFDNNIDYGFNHTYPFVIGAERTSNENKDAVFVPEEAWNIDTKIDDGIGGTGSIVMERQGNHADDCTDGGSPASYHLSEQGVVCALIFRQ